MCLLALAYSSKATRNGIRVSDLRDMTAFATKLTNLSLDGSKRFGADYHYDVKGEIAKYTDIAPTVSLESHEVFGCMTLYSG
jgi:adenylosuccinate synthase